MTPWERGCVRCHPLPVSCPSLGPRAPAGLREEAMVAGPGAEETDTGRGHHYWRPTTTQFPAPPPLAATPATVAGRQVGPRKVRGLEGDKLLC